MSYSDYIYKIKNWLEYNGVSVHPHAFELPNGISGVYRSETNQIFLNVSNAKEALMCIAHEAGHWIGYMLEEKPYSYQRERQAFIYGWEVLNLFHTPITRDEWIHYHRFSENLPDKETKHLYRD